MGGQRPTGPIAQGCGATAAASASSGLKPEPLRVTLLAAEDGFAPILAAARTGGLCGGCGATLPLQGGPYREGLARLKGQVAQLAGPRALTEPELVLVVGPALTLAGYPPLAVAQSEILHLGPAAALGRQAVDGAMHKFLRTEQRFGT
ncbi:hypothetical protein HYH03_007580 [Edaphochlamys debaryana]|uniref:ditrans,polycis-polyprenyl diphosphate synthase [(2E,6E)-farnesyldiphosphate specific] n=1 Tax=Edaphochlamys debaryana TaxID=47281 RepID=A0A835YAZ2_9CHLO|nr:hypothetical protein HYH03_007580 [Edaphochlamys debaryana]|eukprot:KAG2494224.1 hypothetical protein HYH03_007580 [Edaphochlamys debaryana]